MNIDFNEKLQTWINGVNAMIIKYFTENYSHVKPPIVLAENRNRYIRIVYDHSAFAFIDKTNGDILKPANAKAPAKHARGNIFDVHNGLKYIGPFGPAYLK